MTVDRARGSASLAMPEGLPILRAVNSARELAHALFTDTLMRRGFAHVREIALRIGPDAMLMPLCAPGPMLFAMRDDFGESAVFALDPGIVHAWCSASSGRATI